MSKSSHIIYQSTKKRFAASFIHESLSPLQFHPTFYSVTAFVIMAVPKTKSIFPLENRDLWWNSAECGGGFWRGSGVGKIRAKLAMNCRVNDECRRYRDYCLDTGGGNGRKKDEFVEMMREAWPYFQAHGGRTFVVVLCAEVIESANLGSILENISLLHGLGIKFVLVPGTHLHIDKGYEPKYKGKYKITDPNSLKAAMESAGNISQIIESKLSPGPSLHTIHQHGNNTHSHHTVTVATGNFLAAKKRGVVNGIDYGATGEVKKIHVSRIRERLDNDSIVILSNLGHSSSGEVLNCNKYEVATACALALGAERVVCILNGPILDEEGRVFRFLTHEDADRLICKSEIAANYVKVISGRPSTFQNGVGFDHGGEVGFGQEKSDGHLSELAAAAFMCRGGVQKVHLLDGNISGVLLKELFQRDGVGTMVTRSSC